MTSSTESAETRRRSPGHCLLAAGGGAPRTPVLVSDPYRALDDLMAVVEALCPAWPPREVGSPMSDMRL